MLDTSYPYADADNDRMEDGWESAHGLDPAIDDAGDDPDGDGLTNLEEYNAGLDPQIPDAAEVVFALSTLFTLEGVALAPDSDGDGMPDWWESAHGLDPNVADSAGDKDGDGFSNLEEYNAGTDPGEADILEWSMHVSSNFTTDTGACIYGFGTDTDGDGMPDWWELKYGLSRTTNDAAEDMDGDGLSNLDEYLLGMYPDRDDRWGVAWALSTAFLLDTIGISPDTDGDGMRDDWEIANGTDYLVPDAHLDPDSDGLTNIEEYNSGTDPLVNDWLGPDRIASDNFMVDTGGLELGYFYDSDGDGMPDWWENEHGLLADTPDAHGNPDGDGLDNLEEYNSGSDPNVFDLLIIQSAEGNIFILDTGGRFLDTDDDGIPDWWERKFGGDRESMDPDGDSDDDGISNGDEYIANTDPDDEYSLLQVENFKALKEAGSENWTITWQSQPDRLYRIYSTSDLSTAWDMTPVYQVEGDGTRKSYTNNLDSSLPRFFRIDVELLR